MRLVLIAAQSLDGFITRHAEQGTGFLSAEDQVHLRESLKSFDVSIMGGRTFSLFRERILASTTTRRRIIRTRSPENYKALSGNGSLEFSNLSAIDLYRSLEATGARNIALLGGAENYFEFLREALADEAWITIEPRLFGKGLPLVGGQIDIKLELVSKETLGADTVLLKYLIRK